MAQEHYPLSHQPSHRGFLPVWQSRLALRPLDSQPLTSSQLELFSTYLHGPAETDVRRSKLWVEPGMLGHLHVALELAAKEPQAALKDTLGLTVGGLICADADPTAQDIVTAQVYSAEALAAGNSKQIAGTPPMTDQARDLLRSELDFVREAATYFPGL